LEPNPHPHRRRAPADVEIERPPAERPRGRSRQHPRVGVERGDVPQPVRDVRQHDRREPDPQRRERAQIHGEEGVGRVADLGVVVQGCLRGRKAGESTLFGHKDVRTTITHIVDRGPLGVISPLDR
jgi:hypothetical protein